MAKKGVEYRVVWVQDRPESVQDELNRAAREGFKFSGTTANAVIMERKLKDKDDDKDNNKDKDTDDDTDDDEDD